MLLVFQLKQVKDTQAHVQKSPEAHDSKNSNLVRNKKLSSASQRTLNRKRSQQHLDAQLRNDGDETEEDILLNGERSNGNTRITQRNDNRNKLDTTNFNGSEIHSNATLNENTQMKSRKSKRSNKSQKPTNNVEIKTQNQEVTMPVCQNQDTNGDALWNCVKRDGVDCQNQSSSNHFQDISNIGMIEENVIARKQNNLQDIPCEKTVSFSNDANQLLGNSESENKRFPKEKEKDNCLTTTSFNAQQPDIVSWLPLLSKTSAMQCHDTDENDIKPFRSNVEIPFVSSNLRNNVVKKNTFNCDDIASPKLAARHAMMLERSAAKQAAISQRKRTPSLCFDVTASENSDNECQNNTTPLL